MADEATIVMAETQEEYMARKGLKKGDPIGGPYAPDAPTFETQLQYMARKGIAEGEPLVPEQGTGYVAETQLEYLARKAAEAAGEPAPAKARKGAAAE